MNDTETGTRSDRERIYDDEIAPLLMQVAKKATANNIPLHAIAEWAPGRIGETRSAYRDASFPFVFAAAALQAGGNIDGFVMSVLRFCEEQGISTETSIVARLMKGEARQ